MTLLPTIPKDVSRDSLGWCLWRGWVLLAHNGHRPAMVRNVLLSEAYPLRQGYLLPGVHTDEDEKDFTFTPLPECSTSVSFNGFFLPCSLAFLLVVVVLLLFLLWLCAYDTGHWWPWLSSLKPQLPFHYGNSVMSVCLFWCWELSASPCTS